MIGVRLGCFPLPATEPTGVPGRQGAAAGYGRRLILLRPKRLTALAHPTFDSSACSEGCGQSDATPTPVLDHRLESTGQLGTDPELQSITRHGDWSFGGVSLVLAGPMLFALRLASGVPDRGAHGQVHRCRRALMTSWHVAVQRPPAQR